MASKSKSRWHKFINISSNTYNDVGQDQHLINYNHSLSSANLSQHDLDIELGHLSCITNSGFAIHTEELESGSGLLNLGTTLWEVKSGTSETHLVSNISSDVDVLLDSTLTPMSIAFDDVQLASQGGVPLTIPPSGQNAYLPHDNIAWSMEPLAATASTDLHPTSGNRHNCE